MSADTRALLREALRLPVPQRAEFAAELLDSLDEADTEDPDEVRMRWLEEINRRAQRVEDGTAEFESWDSVRERMGRRFG
jgi:hypothetical protein